MRRVHRAMVGVSGLALAINFVGIGPVQAGDLYPGPHGTTGPMERARVDADKQRGRVTLEITFSRKAMADRWPFAVAFARTNGAYCQPVPWDLKAAAFFESDWQTSTVTPRGKLKVRAVQISERTWRYTITSPLLKGNRLNCVWTSITSPIPEHDWHVSGFALMGRL